MQTLPPDRLPAPPPSGQRPAICAALCVLAILLGSNSQSQANWPQFRGRSGSGAEAGAALPTQLDPRKNILWQVSLPGRGLSSPIVVGDRIFITCSSGPKQDRLHVICFSASDGSKLWERQFYATGRTMCHEKTSVAANTPASDGERIYALFSSNDLVALDLEGRLLWVRALSLDYPNVSNSLGMSSSLVVADGTVIAQVENDTEPLALGLDASSGTNRWKLLRPKLANWTSPVLFRNSDESGPRELVCLQSGRGLLAVEPKTGREVWNYTEGAATIPSTAVGEDVLYVPSSGITAIKPAGPGQPPTRLWRVGGMRPDTSSPLVLGNRIFVVNGAGVMTCGDTSQGQRLWQLRMKGPFSASPVAAGRFIYLVNEKGLLQVVDSASAEGELVSELDLEDTVLGTPAISTDALYLRSDAKLWKIGGS